jgi:uncharacterized protein YqiB (DUF1249 family)
MDPYSHPFACEESIARANCIFEKLVRFAPDLLNLQQGIKFEVEGYFAPICLDVIDSSEGYRCIQLSHCWTDDAGNHIPDPDIVISLYPDWELAEARIHKDKFSCEVAYPVKCGPVDMKVHQTINTFLERWLDALLSKENVRRVGEA